MAGSEFSALESLASVNWLEVIKTGAAAGTLLVAMSALKNWKRQDRAKREVEFVDSLIEATHKFTADMLAPLIYVQIAKIGMTSHVPQYNHSPLAGAVAYIKKDGGDQAKELRRVMEEAQPSVIRLRSLSTKGQVFQFPGYGDCKRAVDGMATYYDLVEALLTVLGSPSWDWNNPDVQAHLRRVVELDPDEMRKGIKAGNRAVLEFSRETYQRLYA
ncbi:hypothetical protein [Pseudoxanthomonas sp. PXM04]|uniref:hypothetical protein n=1 Tax=Pseudoxanthomonas sp. PXM04 TaxID=2769297 RepID=UPI0017850F6F|nr:hypothetical protein [Pseudoxanthomonas sp. PXM04]MBD9376183.1 hypothetical protein [Pseudoxanthomonas sp. PXM04]